MTLLFIIIVTRHLNIVYKFCSLIFLIFVAWNPSLHYVFLLVRFQILTFFCVHLFVFNSREVLNIVSLDDFLWVGLLLLLSVTLAFQIDLSPTSEELVIFRSPK
jgi:hypothetical protein